MWRGFKLTVARHPGELFKLIQGSGATLGACLLERTKHMETIIVVAPDHITGFNSPDLLPTQSELRPTLSTITGPAWELLVIGLACATQGATLHQ
jgi:hypothetical protein